MEDKILYVFGMVLFTQSGIGCFYIAYLFLTKL